MKSKIFRVLQVRVGTSGSKQVKEERREPGDGEGTTLGFGSNQMIVGEITPCLHALGHYI